MTSKPIRPYRSLADAKEKLLKSHCWKQGAIFTDGQYPCLTCRCTGRVRDPEEHDPIEGYKLAHWYNCQDCAGTGKVPKATFKKWIDFELVRYRLELLAWEGERRLRSNIVKKLTPEERKFLEL